MLVIYVDFSYPTFPCSFCNSIVITLLSNGLYLTYLRVIYQNYAVFGCILIYFVVLFTIYDPMAMDICEILVSKVFKDYSLITLLILLKIFE